MRWDQYNVRKQCWSMGLLGVLLLSFPGAALADPTITVTWGCPGSPSSPSDYYVDYTDTSHPDVELKTECTSWEIKSVDGASAGNIGAITTDGSGTYGLMITDGSGGDGANDVESIILDPSSDSDCSNLSGSIAGDLLGDLFLQESSGSSGGTLSFTIDGDVEGDLTIPNLSYLRIDGTVESTSAITVGEVVGAGTVLSVNSYGSFAGDLTLQGGLPSGNAVVIVGAMASTASIDFNGEEVAGALQILGGAASGSAISGGAVGADVVLATGGDFDGSVTFSSVSSNGRILIFYGDVDGTIDITGNMAGTITASSGDLNGDVTIGGELTGEICDDTLDAETGLGANFDVYCYANGWTICEEYGCTCTCDYDSCDDCDDNDIWDECDEGSPDAVLIDTTYACGDTLTRTQDHVLRFTFACGITAPDAGEVEIRELLANGQFGSDLSSSFAFTVENGNVLRVEEDGTVLDNETWYAVLNDGGWSGVDDFEMDYVVVRGDANNSGFTNYSDLSTINANLTDPAEDDDRNDIDASGAVNSADVSTANDYINSEAEEKPTGHTCTLP